jgi:hypothetical protein
LLSFERRKRLRRLLCTPWLLLRLLRLLRLWLWLLHLRPLLTC